MIINPITFVIQFVTSVIRTIEHLLTKLFCRQVTNNQPSQTPPITQQITAQPSLDTQTVTQAASSVLPAIPVGASRHEVLSTSLPLIGESNGDPAGCPGNLEEESGENSAKASAPTDSNLAGSDPAGIAAVLPFIKTPLTPPAPPSSEPVVTNDPSTDTKSASSVMDKEIKPPVLPLPTILESLANMPTTDVVVMEVTALIEKLKSLRPSEYESAPYYSQCYQNLVTKGGDALVRIGTKNLVVEGLSQELPQTLVYYAVYRLLNEATLARVQDQIAKRKNWDELKAPGDGNCMLWACLLANRMRSAQNPHQLYRTYQTLHRDQNEHPEYYWMNKDMLNLRCGMADTFSEMASQPDAQEFLARFLFYVYGSEALKKEIAPNANWDELLMDGKPTNEMIKNYCNYLKTPRNWNGEFEAELVAKLLNRPIAILRGTRTNNLQFGTIAGCNYVESFGDPLFIRHNGDHYDCLL